MTAFDAVLVVHRTGSGFRGLPLQDSVKKWQRGFFYVNVNPADDRINLPPFVNEPPIERQNWKTDLLHPVAEVKFMCARLELLEAEGLTAVDLLGTMVARRVLSLQRRPNLIC